MVFFLTQLVVSEALPIPGSAELLLPLANGLLAWGFVILWLGLTWNIFPSPNTSRVSKVHLKNTTCVVCSSGPSSWVRFDDASFPLCGLRRQKSERAWLESWKWRSFELLPAARELWRSIIFPPWVPKGLSSHFCGIVEYPFLCRRKMKGLSISDWSGGSSSYWESFIFFFFYCIGCLNENANYNKYCKFNKFSRSICEFKMCDFKPIFLYRGSF